MLNKPATRSCIAGVQGEWDAMATRTARCRARIARRRTPSACMPLCCVRTGQWLRSDSVVTAKTWAKWRRALAGCAVPLPTTGIVAVACLAGMLGDAAPEQHRKQHSHSVASRIMVRWVGVLAQTDGHSAE